MSSAFNYCTMHVGIELSHQCLYMPLLAKIRNSDAVGVIDYIENCFHNSSHWRIGDGEIRTRIRHSIDGWSSHLLKHGSSRGCIRSENLCNCRSWLLCLISHLLWGNYQWVRRNSLYFCGIQFKYVNGCHAALEERIRVPTTTDTTPPYFPKKSRRWTEGGICGSFRRRICKTSSR